MIKHKVFISFHHAEADEYKKELINLEYFDEETYEYQKLFLDYSVFDGEIDDNLSPDKIFEIIRDEHIKDATVLILLCTKKAKERKYIDWELVSAMRDTKRNKKMGIVVINMPDIEGEQCVYAPTEEEKSIISKFSKDWFHIDSRAEYEKYFPYMPKRILDCFIDKHSEIAVVNWSTIISNPKLLVELIDIAYNRKSNVEYSFASPTMQKNSPSRNPYMF